MVPTAPKKRKPMLKDQESNEIFYHFLIKSDFMMDHFLIKSFFVQCFLKCVCSIIWCMTCFFCSHTFACIFVNVMCINIFVRTLLKK